jgi:hypothetical protein
MGKPGSARFNREEDRMELRQNAWILPRPRTKIDADCTVESCFWNARLFGQLFKHGCKETVARVHSGDGAQKLAAYQRVEVF